MGATWTTSVVEPTSQISLWQNITRECFSPLEVVGGGQTAFRAAAELAAKGRLRLSRVNTEAHQARQTRSSIGSSQAPGFSVKVVVEHTMRVRQFGEDVTLSPGDIALIDVRSPCEIDFPEGANLIAVFLPDELIRRLLGPRGRPSSVRLRGSGLGALIGSYVDGLWRIGEEEVGDMDFAMLDHLATLIGRAARDTAAAPLTEMQHRITCERILAEIETGLGDADLSAEEVARRLRISRSHLYQVLVGSGLTFSGTLRERRLQAARRYLMDERFSATRVVDIALRCGYSDAASFTRAYGKRFGQSPMASRGNG